MNNSMARKQGSPVISSSSCLLSILLGLAIFAGLFFILSVRLSSGPASGGETDGRAYLTVIPAPTLTPTVYLTPTQQTLEIHYVSEDGLSVGTTVEVYDTGGTGLSVRPRPGTGGILNFVAYDGERYVIIGGPDSKNDYIWWELEDVNDPERSGWAVSDYLRSVQP